MRYLFLFPLLACLAAGAQPEVELTPVAQLSQVVDVKHAGDGSGRLFLVQKSGSIRVLRNGALAAEPWLDIASRVSTAGEQGLLSIAFAPDFATSRRAYVYYTDTTGRSTLARYRERSQLADPESAEVLLQVDQPFSNHNGGRLEFGPDGMLYLGIGDGGSGGDPMGNGQDPGTLLGALLRLDVSGSGAYSIPADNPLVDQPGARDEIWATGLRNPWRMAFDRATGELYIADVGQNRFEEINVQAAGSAGGENYGWNLFEGDSCFGDAEDCAAATGLSFPVFVYDHGQGCSITGGQVYRGPDYPELMGDYLYGDFCNGQVRALRRIGDQWQDRLLVDLGSGILTFGEDRRGDLYVAGQGTVYRLDLGARSGPADAPAINRGMAGAWYDPETDGQGILLDVDAERRFLFLAWFTFQRPAGKLGAPEQRWLTAQGRYHGSSANIPVYNTTGGAFDDGQAATTTPIGNLILGFRDCDSASLDYRLDGDELSGRIELVRLTEAAGDLCRELAEGGASAGVD